MKKRGRVLRDTSNGVGLISSDGNQYEFNLEGVWKSDVSPTVNMVVEFDLDDANKIIGINALSESHLAKEQADKVLSAAKIKGGAVFDEAVARMGKPVLIAIALVAISWFFLSAITVQFSQDMAFKIPFWKILGMVNNGVERLALDTLREGSGGDTGIYGFLAIAALLGPFASQFWKDSRAHLGNCLPLIMMLFIAASVYFDIQNSMKSAGSMGSMFGGARANEFVHDMVSEMMRSLHVGVGAYISIISSSYLAFVGLKKYLASKA